MTNHSAWRHHHKHTSSKSTFTRIHFSSKWRNANMLLLLLLLLDLHIAQHIPNSTVAPTHHVFPKHSFFSKCSKIYFSNFWGALSRGLWGFCPSFSNSPTPATYPHILSQLSTSILTSFFTVLPNGSTQTSYVLAIHPRMTNLSAQPIHGLAHHTPRSGGA